MELNQILLLVAFAVTMTYTPGPSNILLMGTAMQSGFRKTMPMLLGVVFGFLLVAISVTLGLGEIFKLFPITLDIIRVLGTIYLLYLAYKIYLSRKGSIESKNASNPTFIRGALVHPFSPKAWMMMVSAYSQFVNIENSVLTQSIIIVAALVMSGASANILWMLAGSALQKYLQNEKIVYWTYTLLAVSLVILIISMWF